MTENQEEIKKFNLVILISGSASTAIAVHKAIESGELLNINIKKIISNSPRISGIKNLINAGFPKEKIKAIDKKEINNEKLFNEELFKSINETEPDLICQFGWLCKTPLNLIKAYPGKIINQHPGPLDTANGIFGGKGMYGIHVHRAVLDFAKKNPDFTHTKATTHYVTEEYDEGKIIATKELEINTEESPESLAARLLPLEHRLQIEVINNLKEQAMLSLSDS